MILPELATVLQYRPKESFARCVLINGTSEKDLKQALQGCRFPIRSLGTSGVKMPDGITRMWLYLAYSESLSTNGNVYFHVSNYGVISK